MAAADHYSGYGAQRRRHAFPGQDVEFKRLIDEAKARHNLSDIVGRHTALKKRGARELVGLCPFHSERSPSFEVNDAKGTYHCHGCGAGGDAIRFLMEKDGMTFRDAIEALTGEAFPVVSEAERAKRAEQSAHDRAERIALAQSIWAKAVPAAGTPAEVYARSRGITMPLPSTVRFVMTPRWRDPETGEVGRDIPAMCCALQDETDAIVGVQCIFLDRGGREKYARPRRDGSVGKAKLTFGVIVGAALRLGPPASNILLCEGPEDGLTLRQELPGHTVLVACGTALMSRISLPPWVRQITLAGDNGEAGAAAVEESRAAYLSAGKLVTAVFPDPAFKDWNDQLRGVLRS